jgi:hypothetical protein
MNTIRVSFIAALLSASSAYAGAAPHWSAAIGTGRASSSDSTLTQSRASGVPSPAHWSASIGTGHATEATKSLPARPAASKPVNASAHWTSKIGTGRASESNAGAQSSAAVASRTRS